MAEHAVKITVNPENAPHYAFSAANLAGVAAPNTYFILYNPVGSRRTLWPITVGLSNSASAAVSTTTAMRAYRFSGAPTGGTSQAVGTIAKFRTGYRDPVANIRLDNPTVTLGPALWSTPPEPTTGAGGGGFVHEVDLAIITGGFTLAEDEGIAINCQLGDIDQVWNVSAVWRET